MECAHVDFYPPIYLRSPHLQTIVPALLRPNVALSEESAVLELPDGDFLELRWCIPPQWNPNKGSLTIISHGLEGSMESSYVRGLAKTLYESGCASLRWNMRGCGERQNRLKTWYHSGSSEDLRAVIHYAQKRLPNTKKILIGISVGGNITAKYLGEDEHAVLSTGVIGGAIVSAPLDLEGSAETLAKPSRAVYMRHLLQALRKRIKAKNFQFPDAIDVKPLASIKTFHEFDQHYTAPIHGFPSVKEYWHTCSGIHFVDRIRVPILILTALDDPFLSPSCIPHSAASSSQFIILETPRYGGHVGFIDSLHLRRTWLEKRLQRFVLEISRA